MNKNQEKMTEKAFAALNRDFLVLGHTRVSSWHAWLVIGLAAGVAAGTILVANRSGEFESSLAVANSIVAQNGLVASYSFYEGSGSQTSDSI